MAKKSEKKTECKRVPIVAILGHVDHGKTTILDRIREANVQACEAGGITQKISVFTVTPDCEAEDKITFIDTPGHEAFDLMRLRGGNIADITLLIVAANDGVQPQTRESIEIINNSTTKPIVVINKVDLPGNNLEKVKRELANEGIQVEDMGGDVPYVEVSGKTGKGIDELLDLINLVIEVEGLQKRKDLPKGVIARAIVLESVKEKSRGNVSTVVVTQGCVSKGEYIGYKSDGEVKVERVKALVSEEGENIESFNPGCGGKIIGISELLDLGSDVYILESKDKKVLKELYKEEVKEKDEEDEKDVKEEVVEIKEEGEAPANFFETEEEEEEEIEEFPVIIKSSSEGSLEALRNSLKKMDIEGAELRIIDSGVGDISMKDVERAQIANAIILGFEVGAEKGVKDIARKNNVLVKTYDIIYKLTEEISDALNLLTIPDETEEEIGNAKVKAIFTLSDGSTVLGNRVQEGKLKRDCKVYVVRDDEIVGEGKIKSLKINKNDVNEVTKGVDSGVILDSKVDAQEGDEIYCYKVVR